MLRAALVVGQRSRGLHAPGWCRKRRLLGGHGTQAVVAEEVEQAVESGWVVARQTLGFKPWFF